MKKLIVLFTLMIVHSAFADVCLSSLKSSDLSVTIIDPVVSTRSGPYVKGCSIIDYENTGLAKGRSYEPGVYNVKKFSVTYEGSYSLNSINLDVMDSRGRSAFGVWCIYTNDSFEDLNGLLTQIGLKANLKTSCNCN